MTAESAADSRQRRKAWEYARQVKLKSEGRCVQCRKEREAGNVTYCDRCLETRRLLSRKKYEARRRDQGKEVKPYTPRGKYTGRPWSRRKAG